MTMNKRNVKTKAFWCQILDATCNRQVWYGRLTSYAINRIMEDNKFIFTKSGNFRFPTSDVDRLSSFCPFQIIIIGNSFLRNPQLHFDKACKAICEYFNQSYFSSYGKE